ncbi:unnamed protein product [Nyctereutes procyonoides]|uniref:(raccoon dog) hypothetical protein n=1 Tax=Nyctereutes procyonoides TaxID=34880 RepID=A0A811ZUE8_NYCPR|nr:unnamed protein product [Nyctereutes procyonoides]
MNFFPKNSNSTMAEIVFPFLFPILCQPWNSNLLSVLSPFAPCCSSRERQDNISSKLYPLFSKDFVNIPGESTQGNLIPTEDHTCPISHQAIQEYQRSGVLKTSFQADPRHTKEEKKATVLILDPGGFFPRRNEEFVGQWNSSREYISRSLKKATPRGESEHIPQKRNPQPFNIIGTSHLSVFLLKAINPTDTQHFHLR